MRWEQVRRSRGCGDLRLAIVLPRTPSTRSSKNYPSRHSGHMVTGTTSRSYLNSSSPTPRASASLRVVRTEAIRRSSSKSEIDSAEIALLAESCLTDTPRSLRTLFRLCSSGIEWLGEGLPRPPSSRWWAESTYPTHRGVDAPLRAPLLPSGLRRIPLPRTPLNKGRKKQRIWGCVGLQMLLICAWR
jgi:hypothetical protein